MAMNGGRWEPVRTRNGRGLPAALAIAVVSSAALGAQDPEPLRARIDRAIEASQVGPPAAPADDAAFLRRASLDLTGRIPSSRDARAFLDDPSPGKRATLVDRLLESHEHVRHMAVTIDVWLMERRPDRHVKSDEWRTWLVAFLAANRPFTELAREVLAADGADPARRAPARFSLDREAAPDALTRDVGRVFFGVDLQCAQCHDHPRIEDYVQRDYYGLYAFLNRAAVFQPDAKKPAVLMEKADGDVAYKSVFTKFEGSARPRLPDGPEIGEPAFPKGEEYRVKPDPKDKNLRPVPKFSRRAELARVLGEGASPLFRRNVVNRLWAHMMGRGIVEPLDLHHSSNPPSHPELLDLLAAEFAGMNFDLRRFLRELAMTRTYQRGLDMPTALAGPAREVLPKLAALDAEAARLAEEATRAEDEVRKAAGELDAARKEAATVAAELGKAEAAAAEARKAHDAAAAELAARKDLRMSLVAAAEAAAKAVDDAELAGAAAIFQARAGKLAVEIETLGKALPEKEAAARSAETAAAGLKAKREEAAARVKAKVKTFDDADGRRKSTRIAASCAANLATDARTLADFGALQAAAAEAQESQRRIAAELAAAQAFPRLEAAAAEARKARAAATAAAAAKEQALEPVLAAAAKAEEVARKAAKDVELVATAARVKARRDALSAALAGLQKTAVESAAADAKAEAERAAAGKLLTGKGMPELESALKTAAEKAQLEKSRRDEAFGALTAVWTRRFGARALDPLTPEQIGWSMMQAAGLVEPARDAAAAEWAKKNPPGAEADRDRHLEEAVYGKLKGNETPFVKLFGGGPGQLQDEFYATVDQALFLENGALVRGWLAPAGGNLTGRLGGIADPKALAAELYLSVFTRLPTDREAAEVARYLAARPAARPAAIQELVWAMLSSVEFRFRH